MLGCEQYLADGQVRTVLDDLFTLGAATAAAASALRARFITSLLALMYETVHFSRTAGASRCMTSGMGPMSEDETCK